MLPKSCSDYFFFYKDTATTEIYTLSLHDALPIFVERDLHLEPLDAARILLELPDLHGLELIARHRRPAREVRDRKSTRLNSSHVRISYAVFCLKKKKFLLMSRSYLIIRWRSCYMF